MPRSGSRPGRGILYAQSMHARIETRIDHIGEVNEMIDFAPDYAVSPWATVAEGVGEWLDDERPITQEVTDALAALSYHITGGGKMIDVEPDIAISPWESVAEAVEEWLTEDRPITQEVADALAALYPGLPSSFFVRLEEHYRKTRERLGI